uniref:Uncharacterized protein n=1 Tax=Oryza punctata TaxID=4537 RepID=A0A0E0K1B7_ORYPU
MRFCASSLFGRRGDSTGCCRAQMLMEVLLSDRHQKPSRCPISYLDPLRPVQNRARLRALHSLLTCIGPKPLAQSNA